MTPILSRMLNEASWILAICELVNTREYNAGSSVSWLIAIVAECTGALWFHCLYPIPDLTPED